jgi:oligopeptide/dipeptide ABC transporter ATP-binding protein
VTVLLDVDRLAISLRGRAILHEVSLQVAQGEAVGLVGESGSGKSMTARAIVRALPPGARVSGQIDFAGRDVCTMGPAELRSYRAGQVAMIFQDPRAHINPVRTVGDFLTEGMRANFGVSRAAAASRARDLMDQVRVSRPADRLRQYPHEMSGGMLQRVMIAAALAVHPRLLLADEPTTALDVTTQSEVMAILQELRSEHDVAMLFITHDLELAAATCDRTAVMYAGRIVEDQPSALLHDDPLHPYTAGLVASRPSITTTAEFLPVLPGRPQSASEAGAGCAFAPRCRHAVPGCTAAVPQPRRLGGGMVACHRAEDLRSRLLEGITHA